MCPPEAMKHEKGEGDALRQTRGQRMRLEVVDGDEGLAARQRHALARHQPDQHAADEARTRRGRHAIEVLGRNFARFSARAISKSMISTWARAAISGTTPPKGACAAIWLITSSARISPVPSGRSRTTAAAVSSQVVSMPRTRMIKANSVNTRG